MQGKVDGYVSVDFDAEKIVVGKVAKGFATYDDIVELISDTNY